MKGCLTPTQGLPAHSFWVSTTCVPTRQLLFPQLSVGISAKGLISMAAGGLVDPPWCGEPSPLPPSTTISSLLGHLLTPDHAGLASHEAWLKMWVLRGVGVACFVGVVLPRAWAVTAAAVPGTVHGWPSAATWCPTSATHLLDFTLALLVRACSWSAGCATGVLGGGGGGYKSP